MPRHVLFIQSNILDVLRNQETEIKRRVQTIAANQLLSASEPGLIDSLIEEFRLNAPVLEEDEIYIAESVETQVDVRSLPNAWIYDISHSFCVPGTRTVIAVPFKGESAFFDVQPQTHGSPPEAEISNGEVLLTYVRTDHDGRAIKREYQQAVSNIKRHLDSLEQSARQFNSRLEGLVTSELRQRKQRLLDDAGMPASIGLPLKKRSDAPTTYTVPVKKRVAKIDQIKVEGAFKPEPALSHSDYEEILRIMKNMALVMERSPRAFADMEEEMLRWHFLVQLNGAYEGQATGETFNFQGKTDVLIRVDGRNVFIAECKFWKGEKAFLETIDQLVVKYLSWRDTKAAVVVFNRNANFSGVLAKIQEIVPNHPNYKRQVGRLDESTFRYVFAQPNDPNREITLTVLAFDIPSGAENVVPMAQAS
jgi:hypothetical protein